MKITSKLTLSFIAYVAIATFTVNCYSQETPQDNLNKAFIDLINSSEKSVQNDAFSKIDREWHDDYISQLLETASLSRRPDLTDKIFSLLKEKTKQDFGYNSNDWYYWLWNKPERIKPEYANFKADVYRLIDPVFEGYFRNRQDSARVRLDEIRWGGVVQDGIPPLRNPEMIEAQYASYLDEDNLVFGIEINGDARAYPKRILAWHEMFVDTVGGVNIAGVYCTLCGTVIPYKTNFNGVAHELGTSGFLYRSNKLMYDKATQSLWNTITGEPVLGPLVDMGIALEHLSVVTTTWGEWKRRHPLTTVLSLDTGHRRNYNEGIAYKDYFSSDRMMFNTPFKDERLQNKREILALRFTASPKEQLAIDTQFLNKNPLYITNIGQQKVLILTDLTGANRVYDPEDIEFISYDQDSKLVDVQGYEWQLTEESIIRPDQEKRLTRLPYHRAFWFGWLAAYPETRLIK